MTELTINPDTLQIEGIEHGRGYTADEVSAMVRPPCPVCGTPIVIDTLEIAKHGDLRRLYLLGRWECGQGCDPR